MYIISFLSFYLLWCQVVMFLFGVQLLNSYLFSQLPVIFVLLIPIDICFALVPACTLFEMWTTSNSEKCVFSQNRFNNHCPAPRFDYILINGFTTMTIWDIDKKLQSDGIYNDSHSSKQTSFCVDLYIHINYIPKIWFSSSNKTFLRPKFKTTCNNF